MPDAPHIFELTPDDLAALLARLGLARFRKDQVLDWVYQRHVADVDLMSNLSKADRAVLGQHVRFATGRVVRHQVATDGVQKLLVEWPPPVTGDLEASGNPPLPPGEGGRYSGRVRAWETNKAPIDAQLESENGAQGNSTPSPSVSTRHPLPEGEGEDSVHSLSDSRPLRVLQGAESGEDPRRQSECVMIPSEQRRTACISSQIGCPVGCRFCASGLGGLDGNLSAGQIVEQVWRLGTLEGVGRISHVVFMGMGEPLANFENVTRALQMLTAPWGLGISARRITISTVGLPAQIRRLAEIELPVTLALSLHAPNDELRRQLIPWAQYVTIQQLIEACRFYFDHTGREITLEYILLRQVNDRPEHARELAQVARKLRANVNLIRYNEVKDLPYSRPGTEDVREFQAILRRAGVNAHIRASRGRDIAAACGQLRHEHAAAGG